MFYIYNIKASLERTFKKKNQNVGWVHVFIVAKSLDHGMHAISEYDLGNWKITLYR